MNDTADCWISAPVDGARKLSELCRTRSEQRIAAGKFTRDDVTYIDSIQVEITSARLALTEEHLEKLRRLCQVWDIALHPRAITSHRRFVGPLIVAAKRLCFPLMRALLKDMIHQQRSFNAAAIALLAHLSSEVETLKRERNRDLNSSH